MPRSSLQLIRAGQKHHEALLGRKLPTYSTIQEWKHEQLVEEYLAGCSGEYKETFAGFAKRNKVSEQKLRKTMKNLTGATIKKHNPKSNNLQTKREKTTVKGGNSKETHGLISTNSNFDLPAVNYD